MFFFERSTSEGGRAGCLLLSNQPAANNGNISCNCNPPPRPSTTRSTTTTPIGNHLLYYLLTRSITTTAIGNHLLYYSLINPPSTMNDTIIAADDRGDDNNDDDDSRILSTILHPSAAATSTTAAAVAASCTLLREKERIDYEGRVLTYKATTYYAKPACLSPLFCSRFGYVSKRNRVTMLCFAVC
jgi:hypothetical protein